MAPHDRIREHARQAREAAHLATDLMTKARLLEIANNPILNGGVDLARAAVRARLP
jgi:hypothetical protein